MKLFRLLTCPKCRRRAYVVCSNRKCQCWRRVPKGKKPLKPTRDGNGEKCAYCGFKAPMDWWFDRSTVQRKVDPSSSVSSEGGQ